MSYQPQVSPAQLQQLLDNATTASGKDQFWTAVESEVL